MEVGLTNKAFLQLLNKILLGACVLILIFFIIALMRSKGLFTKIDYTIQGENTPLVVYETLKNLADYKKEVSSRELFRPFIFSQKKSVTIETIDDITKDLILVGVVSVDNKEAIVKNRRTMQTYFVSVGSRIGELTIVDITGNTIEVGYKQERKVLAIQ
ncbi:MAG: hypothetical protein KKH94_07960 [Candidatus Omnitrophica bacterium]|nr:hypothetical protein [Candidatus Omnitrophota bacterium]